MAFNGSLIALSGDNFPLTYVFKESYKITPDARLDLDPFRSTEGYLMRNVLAHTASKVTFQVKPMWNEQHAEMWSFIRAHYTNELERKVELTYWQPETDDYKTGEFYIPDFSPQMDLVSYNPPKILILSYELQFIEY